MMPAGNKRQAFKQWVTSWGKKGNYFFSPTSSSRDHKLCLMTREGLRFFESKIKASTSRSYQSILDMTVINSFMAEKEEFQKYSYKPNLSIDLNCGLTGLVSLSSIGIPKNLKRFDNLLCTKQTKGLILSDSELILKISRREKLSQREFIHILNSAIVPKAFEHLIIKKQKNILNDIPSF